jgi:hypothetical protein
MTEVLELTQNEIRALLNLIVFHDDHCDKHSDEVFNIHTQLYDKVSALQTY